ERIWTITVPIFQLEDERGQKFEIKDEYDALKIIYTLPQNRCHKIYYQIQAQTDFLPLSTLALFWEELLLPFVEYSEKDTKLAFQKIEAARQADQFSLQARTKFRKQLPYDRYDNMWKWILELEVSTRSPLLMQFASLRGNPTHPLSKLKKGFNESENQQYAPEFAQVFEVPVLAVACGLCRVTKQRQSIDVRNYFQAAFPETYENWENAVRTKNLNPIHFYPLPIHPFQWKFIKDRFQSDLAEGLILYLANTTIDAQASMSLRTLMPTAFGAPHIKLPINIQTTSMMRTHSPPRVHGGPILSRLLDEILARDLEIAQYLKIMNEPLGIYIKDDAYYQESQNPSYHLNVLYKQNPEHCLAEDEIYVPLSAAFEFSPFTNQPLIIDIMQANGIEHNQEALNYFQDYAWKVIRSQIGLYAAYGIALEGHQQNTALVFSLDGIIQHTVVGDLAGGVEIYEPILQMCGWNIKQDIHPTKKHIFEEGEIPEQQLLHTIINYHLLPFAVILSDSYSIALEQCLDIISAMISETISIYRTQPRHLTHESDVSVYRKELERIERVLLREDVQVRSLLKMNLAGVYQSIYTSAQNLFRSVNEVVSS
ncbi:MAG: IucA/IucC family protein, partial [Bacteroidota bacterium]